VNWNRVVFDVGSNDLGSQSRHADLVGVVSIAAALAPAVAPGDVVVADAVVLPSGGAIRCDPGWQQASQERRHPGDAGPDRGSSRSTAPAARARPAVQGYVRSRTPASHHVHVWKNLLERAGFMLEDIPKQWDAFWSFWCDRVQPAVREVLGRDDIWGVGLPMSPTSVDTANGFWQFVSAYEADYVTRDGRLVIDDPEVRRKLIEVIDSYTAIYRKGCTPPDSLAWDGYGNNKAFLDQTIVMTLNQTLSTVNALKRERPEDYYDNAVTVDWPAGAYSQPLVIETFVNRAVAFEDGGHVATAKEFVRFLVGEGWLAALLAYGGVGRSRTMPFKKELSGNPSTGARSHSRGAMAPRMDCVGLATWPLGRAISCRRGP